MLFVSIIALICLYALAFSPIFLFSLWFFSSSFLFCCAREVAARPFSGGFAGDVGLPEPGMCWRGRSAGGW
uniref:Putative secreted peptide n=1 Tax=Anopheles braziliensis TaxID=58242 RepID=A0A2M3ZR16_9DIPT